MTDKININDTIKEAAAKHITVDAGVATVAPEAIEAAFNAAGVDPKEYKRQQKAVSDATVGLLHVVGEKAVDAMHKDKELATVTSTFRMGHDEVSATINRQSEVLNRFKPNEPAKTVYGDMSVKVKSKVGGSSIKALRETVSVAAAGKLGK